MGDAIACEIIHKPCKRIINVLFLVTVTCRLGVGSRNFIHKHLQFSGLFELLILISKLRSCTELI